MKDWQRRHIEKNMPDLIRLTRVTDLFLARMSEKDFLTNDNCEVLKACKTKTEQSAKLYSILLENDDVGSYEHLTDVLERLKQTKSAQILRAGVEEKKRMEETTRISEKTKRHKYLYNNEALQDVLDFAISEDPLKIIVARPNESQAEDTEYPYSLPPRGKGYALIINVKEVSGHVSRSGSDFDALYMAQLWSQLGFEIFPEKEKRGKGHWTKAEIRDEVVKFHFRCQEDSVDAMVFFIGSHGTKDTVADSHGNEMNVYTEFVYKMQLNNCQEHPSKARAKIFIIEACQSFTPGGGLRVTSNEDVEVNNTICIKAQIPGKLANRDIYRGSWFVVAFTYVMMMHAWNIGFIDLLEDVGALMSAISKFKDSDGNDLGRFQHSMYEVMGLKSFVFFPK